MPIDYLPLMQKYVPGYNTQPPELTLPPTQAAQSPDDADAAFYNSLSPMQKKQVELSLNPRGTIAELGAGLLGRGLTYEAPQRIGKALQMPGQPGDTLYDWGTKLQEATADNAVKYMADPSETAHNIATRSIAEGGAQVVGSMAPALAAVPLALAGLPGAGLVGLGVVGATAFGSQFTDTYNKMIKTGHSPEEARQTGQLTGTVEAFGDVAGSMIGFGAAKGGKAILSTLGKTGMSVPDALKSLGNPSFWKDFGKVAATATAGETAVETAQGYATAAIEKQAGADTQDPYEAAVASIAPTLGMMPWILPFSAFGIRASHAHNQKLVQQATQVNPNLPTSNQQLAQMTAAQQALTPTLQKMTGDEAAIKQWRGDQIVEANKQIASKYTQQDEGNLQDAMQQTAARQAERDAAEQAAQQQAAATATAQQQATQQATVAQQAQQAASIFSQQAQPAVTPPIVSPFMSSISQMRQDAQTPYAQTVEQMRQAQGAQQERTGRMATMQRSRDAAKAVAGVAAAKNETERKAAVAQVIVNPPEGAMTFSQFVAGMQAERKAQKGELKLKGGKQPTQAEYQDAYVGYVNNHLQQQPEQVVQPETAPGQQQLFTQRSVPHELALQAQREAGWKSEWPFIPADLGNADFRTMIAKDPSLTQSEKHSIFAAGEKLGVVPRGEKEALNAAQAQAQERTTPDAGPSAETAGGAKSTITPLPADAPLGLTESGRVRALPLEGLQGRWQALHGEQKITKQDQRSVSNAFNTAAEYEGLAKQIHVLRTAAGKLKENSPARTSLNSLIAEMGTRHESEIGHAQANLLEGDDAIRFPETERQISRTGEAGQDQPEGGAGVGQREQGLTLAERAETARVIQKKKTNLIPKAEQRKTRQERFAFEHYTYDDTRSPVNRQSNQIWLDDYIRAQNLAKGLTELGDKVNDAAAGHTDQLNAAAALHWLSQYEGADIPGRAQAAQKRREAILAVNERARKSVQKAAKQLEDQLQREHEKRLGKPREQMTREEMDRITQEYNETINSSRAYRNVTQRKHINELRRYAFEDTRLNYGADPLGIGDKAWRDSYAQAHKDLGSSKLEVREHAQTALDRLEAQDPLADKVRRAYEERLGKTIDKMTAKQRAALQQTYEELAFSSEEYKNAADKISFDEHIYDVNIDVAVRSGSLENVLAAVEASEFSERMQPLVDRIRALGLKTTFQAWHGVTDPRMQREVAKRWNAANAKGAKWGGTYFYRADTAVIKEFSVHAVMHELNHAAQMARLLAAENAEKVSEYSRTSQEVELVKDLQELRKLMERAKFASKTKRDYGFKDVHEFLTEANSNLEFQDKLKKMVYKGKNLWDSFVEWMGRVLGRADASYNNALEHALDLSRRFENQDMTGLENVAEPRFGEDLGPVADMLGVDRMMAAITSSVEKGLQAVAKQGNVGNMTTRAMLYAMTTRHIQQWYENSPTLAPISAGFKAYFAADSVKTQMVQDKTAEFMQPVRTISLKLDGMKSDEAAAMNKEVSILAGEMSGLNIDLNMGYNLNRQRNPNLEQSAEMRIYVDGLHQRYMALPQEVRTPLEHTFALNRKNFIQQSTTTLRNYLKIRERTIGPQVNRWLSRLDIRDPSLNQGTLPTQGQNKLPYYPDVYTKNLDLRLQAVLAEVRQANVGSEFNKIDEFYRAAVANPYQHLGRMGDHFVEFDIRAGAQSLAQVQQVLKSHNVVIGQPAMGNRHVFMRFESEQERDAAFQAMRPLGAAAVDNLRGGSLADKDHLQTARGVPDFAKTLHSNLDASFDTTGMSPTEAALVKDMHESIKRWALDAIPDMSARKAMTPRNPGRTLGYQADFLRNYTARATSMTSMLANAYSMPLFNKAFADLKSQIEPLAAQDPRVHSEAQMIHDELTKRFLNGLNPVETPVVDGVKAFGHNMFLALSPSFYLINLMQPGHLTWPFLGGQYGFFKAGGAMFTASGKALIILKNTLDKGLSQGQTLGGMKGAILGALDAELQLGTLSPGEAMFVRTLASAGKLDATQGREHEMSRTAAGASLGMIATTKMLSAGAHYTEVFNRLTAGLAGYNLEMAKSGFADKATAKGIEAVAETQFGYNRSNVGRAFSRQGMFGRLTPMVTSFMQYQVQAFEFLLRMVKNATFPIPENATQQQIDEVLERRHAAQKGLIGVMGTTTVIAGSLGLPFVNVAAWLTDVLIDAISSDEEKRRKGRSDVKAAWRSWLDSWAGKKGGQILAHGAGRAINVEWASRAGLQDLLPFSQFITDRRELKDKIRDGALNFFGPSIGGGLQIAQGLGKIFDGKVMEGLIQMSPVALKGPLKAGQMYQEGGYTNTTGNKLPIEMNSWDIGVQAFGFTPGPLAEHREVDFQHKTRDMLLKRDKNLLSNALYRSFEKNGRLSPEERMQLQQWNMQVPPQYKIDLSGGLKRRAEERAVAKISGTTILESKRYLPELKRYQFAAT